METDAVKALFIPQTISLVIKLRKADNIATEHFVVIQYHPDMLKEF